MCRKYDAAERLDEIVVKFACYFDCHFNYKPIPHDKKLNSALVALVWFFRRRTLIFMPSFQLQAYPNIKGCLARVNGGGARISGVLAIKFRLEIKMAINIPSKLSSYFHDSEMRVLAWDASREELFIEVRKDVGLDSGVAVFLGVSFVSLPAVFTADSIKAAFVQDAKNLPSCGIDPTDFDENDLIYFMYSVASSVPHFVIAEALRYEVKK